ncbi:hypothetical protein [Streptomyces sp. NPDC052015]|uniref:hypothetical protein n=1 Tax=Streptomyces sp. NPDC052015 TaxID=3154755 RepID=UPI0034271672
MKDGHRLLDAVEVNEVPGQVVAVCGGMGAQDGDGLLGASGAGEQLGNVWCRVPGGALGVGAGVCDRFVDAVAGGDQRQPYPVQVPVLLAPAGGGEGVEVCQAVPRLVGPWCGTQPWRKDGRNPVIAFETARGTAAKLSRTRPAPPPQVYGMGR